MRFDITAYRASEGVTSLELLATSEAEARAQVVAKGYRIIAIKPSRGGSAYSRARTRFSVALFTEELLGFLDAGLGLLEALDLLLRKARQKGTRDVISALIRALQEGRSFSHALEILPDVFPSLYIATIRTSERTGNLVEAMQRYLAYHKQLNLIRDKVIAASVYPVLLAVAGMLVILFLLGYVVPRFSIVYEDLGNDLPWMSRMLMHWGLIFNENGLLLTVVGSALLVVVVLGLGSQAIRARLQAFVWSVPAFGHRLKLYQLARFTRTLAMLVSGGIPFVAALGMVGDLLQQPALRSGLHCTIKAITEGRSVSAAFAENELATEVGIRLIAVGERAGDLGHALERTAKLYDDEIARWVDWFSRLFEPALMMVIGLVIGVIVLLMYMPIFELANSIQ